MIAKLNCIHHFEKVEADDIITKKNTKPLELLVSTLCNFETFFR
jgi:hypothetical protein